MEFFCANLIFFLLSVFSYLYFRGGISAYCIFSKKSKTFVRKNKKGVVNYWLYRQLHQQHSLSSMYYINFAFLGAFAIFLLCFCLSWIRWMRMAVIVSGIILGSVEIPAIFRAMVWQNRNEFGRAFVIFDMVKGYNGRSRYFVTFLDWIICVFPLGIYLFFLMKLS